MYNFDFWKIELSILGKSTEEINRLLNKLPIKKIHLDIMDGYFVNNVSNINPYFLKELWFDKTDKYKFHLHFMVEDVEIYFDYFYFLKNIKRVSFHVESKFFKEDKFINLINLLKNKWIKIWLVFNPDTKVENYEKYINKFDFIQLMTVYPWKWWQKFLLEMYNKIKKTRNWYNWELLIDWWVNYEVYKKLKDLVDIFVIGSFLFNSLKL